MLQVPVCVHGKTIQAIIDTASEVSIISDKVFNSFEVKPTIQKQITLYAAGREMKMSGYKLGPVEIMLDSKMFVEAVTVAPIEDDMLLGLDFLLKHNATINMEDNVLNIQGHTIKFTSGKVDEMTAQVARVTIKKRVVVPAWSVLRLNCSMDKTMPQCIVEPNVTNLLSPTTLVDEGSNPTMAFVNYNDRHIVLKRNQVVGLATEIHQVLPKLQTEGTTKAVNKVESSESTGSQSIPDHLQELYNRSSQQLSISEQKALQNLLIDYADVFSSHEYDIGNFTAIEHSIDTGDSLPIKQRLRRTPACFAGEEEKHLEKMIKADVIEPSMSEWASPPVLIRKRDGSVRWCVDYRALNKVTKKDVFPLPLIPEFLDSLTGNQWFSKLDATWGYWQVKIKDSDKCKTAFITKYGLFQFKRMGFGLCNAPATFSRVMNLVLKGLHWSVVLAFLDDVLVLGTDVLSHISNLTEVFQRFREYGIKLKARKCDLFQTEVEYLGRTVGRDGMRVGTNCIETMQKWPIPTSTKDVERFCGFANYHRSFIKDFAQISAPLYALTGKNPFHWETEHQTAFEQLKTALTSSPVLTLPTADGKFILDTDASDIAIGAELLQIQNGEERCIAYCSFNLTPEQKRYCTTRKELLAVVRFTRHFRHYLLGRPFDVRTDHSSLQWLMNFRNLNGQLARWLEELSQYQMTIYHRPGAKSVNVDSLSRIPDLNPCPFYNYDIEPHQLPCGGCNYCTRAHQNWSDFIQEVDDAVPLVKLDRRRRDQEVQCDMSATGDILKSTTPRVHTVQQANSDEEKSWVDAYSWNEIGKQQQTDIDFKFVISWLQNQEYPSECDLSLSSPAAKNYWINRELYELDDNGVLWRKPTDQGKATLMVPKSMRNEVLALCHDVPAAGHQGYDRTLARLQQRYRWYAITQDVRRFVSSCAVCNRNKKANRKAKHQMKQFHAGAPMERVHLDFLGPLPVTKRNNSYILMMVDQFTKWVECIPLPNQTAEVTAQAAVNEFFSRFGFPFQILTDRGTNFESDLFQQLCEKLQIHKTRTTPYRPSTNGQVERYNRTLMDSVRCFVSRTPTLWDEYLPQVASALRSAKNRSTGFTANMLMLGREVTMPVDLVFPGPREPDDRDIDEFVLDLIEQIQSVHEIARTNLKSTQATMKRDHDLKTFTRAYKVGDAVYVLDTAAVKGKCRKLCPTWKGPGVVTRKLSDYVYEIRLRQKLVTINHDRLKPCNDRNLPVWVTNYRERFCTKGDQSGSLACTNQYCICRGPDDGTFMIQCDECREWFHGKCVDITPEKAKVIDIYLCPNCC